MSLTAQPQTRAELLAAIEAAVAERDHAARDPYAEPNYRQASVRRCQERIDDLRRQLVLLIEEEEMA